MDAFEGFSSTDFDAYSPDKWASNAFNLQRQSVKEKLEHLGQTLIDSPSFQDMPIYLKSSPSHPSQWNGKKVNDQWLFLLLGSQEELHDIERLADQERTLSLLLKDPLPAHKHLCLSLCLEQSGFFSGLVLWPHASIDAKNLSSRLTSSEGKQEFLSIAEPARHLQWKTDETPLESPEKLLEIPISSFSISRTFSREETLSLGKNLVSILFDIFGMLLPLYRFSAWSLQNDHLKLAEQLQKEAKEREEKKLQEKAALEARLQQKEEERKQAILERQETLRQNRLSKHSFAQKSRRYSTSSTTAANAENASTSSQKPERTPQSFQNQRRDSGQNKRNQRAETHKRPLPKRPKKSSRPAIPATPGSINTGDRVKLLEGLFAGKIGVVQEIDHRREAKVALGKMSVKAQETTLSKVF